MKKMQQKGLGRGLDALLGDFTEQTAEGIRNIDVYSIDINSDQPRKVFDEDKLKELAESIKLHGVVQPIIVREVKGRYVIVAGERRYRAARIAGLKEVPALVKNFSDNEVMEVALIENIQRENLNPIEEAAAIKFLMQQHDLTQEEVATRLSKSRPAIANTLRLLNLPTGVQEYLKAGRIQAGHAKAILSLADSEKQLELADRISKGGVSVRAAEELAREMQTAQAPAKRKAKVNADPDIAEAENQLRSRLGTKVTIQGNQERGKVVIEYFSKDELSGIFDILIRE